MNGEEPRYTLAEAKREIARQECLRFGHDWQTIARGGNPMQLVCGRCGKRSGQIPWDES